ncbi:MAG: thioredoxin domain-containing protein [Myxococcales bacterium]|nr:thioredoxin domain-containing protein [Myxococcales bacterium]
MPIAKRRLLVFLLMLLTACFGGPKGNTAVTLEPKKEGPGLAVDPSRGEPPRVAMTDDADSPVPVFANDAQEGERTALVTIVEFSDLECPFCSRAANTLEALRESFGHDEVRIVWKNYPLDFHAHARALAEAGAGVNELMGPQAFFRYQRAVFEAQSRMQAQGGFNDDSPRRLAEAVGADGRVIEDGLRDRRWAPRVERDIELGRKIGVSGTPAFYINGVSLGGAQPLEKFKAVVTEELAKAKALVAAGTARDRVYVAASKASFKAPRDDDDDEPVDTATYKVPVDGSPARGPKTALVTLVEFSDFECPFCKRIEGTLQQLRTIYGDKLRIVWKDMPLPFHKRALPAALAAREARAQKGDAGFWDMHDRLFDAQPKLEDPDLLAAAKAAGLDEAKMKRALAQGTHKKAVFADEDAGDDVDAAGTPHFFVNGRRLMGAQPLDKFRELIDVELKKAEALVATGISPEAVYTELQKTAVLKTKPVEHKAVALDPKAYSRGPKTAKVTIVQFSDFQCPFCKRAEPTMDELLKAYPKDVRIEWRNLPLSFHQDAELAAEAALEAGAQKGSAGFFKMHGLIFDGHGRPDGLKRPALEGYAKSMGLDMGKFGRALDGHVHLASIKADQATAQAAGISGTPGFVVNGTFISGAQAFRKFRRVIDAELAKK